MQISPRMASLGEGMCSFLPSCSHPQVDRILIKGTHFSLVFRQPGRIPPDRPLCINSILLVKKSNREARVKVKVLTWSHSWLLPVTEGSWRLDRCPAWCLLNDLITNPQFGMNLKISGKRLFEECTDHIHTSTAWSPHNSPNQKAQVRASVCSQKTAHFENLKQSLYQTLPAVDVPTRQLGQLPLGWGAWGHPKNRYCQTHLSQEGTPWNALQIPLCLQSGEGGLTPGGS